MILSRFKLGAYTLNKNLLKDTKLNIYSLKGIGDIISDFFVYSSGQDNRAKKIDPDGIEVWSYNGHSSNVNSISTDPDENVYTGSTDDTVQKVSPEGDHIWTHTLHSGTVNTVAVDVNGNVHSGANDGKYRKADPDGEFLLGTNNVAGGNNVTGVAVDPDESYYVTGDANVRKRNSSGGSVWTFTNHTSNTNKVAVDADQNAYSTSNDNTVRKINDAGSQVWSYDAGRALQGVAIDKDGFVYIGFNSGPGAAAVRKLDQNGDFIWEKTYSDGGNVMHLATDPAGYIYAPLLDDTVRKLDQDSNQIWSFGGHTNGVLGVATQPGLLGAFPNEW